MCHIMTVSPAIFHHGAWQAKILDEQIEANRNAHQTMSNQNKLLREAASQLKLSSMKSGLV